MSLTYLAKQKDNTPVVTGKIAQDMCIPKKFLENILIELKCHGFVGSKMGKGGGYFLLKKAEDITLAKVFRLVDGPIALLPCVSLNFYQKCDECKDEKLCGLNNVLIKIRNANLEILEKQTIADIANQEKNY